MLSFDETTEGGSGTSSKVVYASKEENQGKIETSMRYHLNAQGHQSVMPELSPG